MTKKWGFYIIVEVITDIITSFLFCNLIAKVFNSEMPIKAVLLLAGSIQLLQMIKYGFLTYQTEKVLWQFTISSIILIIFAIFYILNGIVGVEFKDLISGENLFEQIVFASALIIVTAAPIIVLSGFISCMTGALILKIKENKKDENKE